MFWIAVAAPLAGCPIGKPYAPPEVDAQRAAPFDAIRNAPVLATGEPPDHWWRLYNDPVLNGLVADALTANRDLAVAVAHVQRARAVFNEASSAKLPATTAGVGVDYGAHLPDQILAAAADTGTTTRVGYAPSFALSWEVDLWGRVRRLIDAAHANAEAMEAAANAMRVVVAAETTQAYLEACGYGQRADVADHRIAIANQIAALTMRQHQAGLVDRQALAGTRALADDTRADLSRLQGQRQAALYQLAILTGRVPGDVPSAAANCHAIPALDHPFPVGDGASLLRRRPDLRESERQLAAADARTGAAEAALYPSITLGGSVNWLSTSGGPASLGDRYAVTWGIGPLISWHFPNLASSRSQVAQASADETAARAAFDAKVLQALKETGQALVSYGAAWKRHHELEAARIERQTAWRLAQLNYRAGSIDSLEMLDTENRLALSDAESAASAQQVALDQVALFRALGGGWQQ